MKNKLVTNQEMKEILKNESLDVRHKVYYVSEDRRKRSMKPNKSKYTLTQRMDKLDHKVDQLGETVDKLGRRVDQLGETVDKLVVTVSQLAIEMREGFRQVNARIDRIEERLDYNNLKKLPR